jgi:hypothetical protein
MAEATRNASYETSLSSEGEDEIIPDAKQEVK